MSNHRMPARQLVSALVGISAVGGFSLEAGAEGITRMTGAPVARVIAIHGRATVASPGTSHRSTVTRGAELHADDNIATEEDSSVRLLLTDRSIIDVGASTTLNVGEVAVTRGKRTVSVRLTVGRIWARVSAFFTGTTRFEVETKTAVCGVRGTELVVEIDEAGKMVVVVVTGEAELANLAGDIRERLGPMMSGTFTGAGTIEVAEVDPAALDARARDVQPRPSLGPDETESLEEQGLNRPPGDRSPLGPARLDLLDAPATPLESEPGAAAARVRGQLEIRK